MGDKTGIDWTDSTFNIAWGCTKISPGCTHCYADDLSHQKGHDVWGPSKPRRLFGEKHWSEPLAWNRRAEREGVPRKVFCSSMCDNFEDHPDIAKELARLWGLIRETPWLRWQLLTKRADRIAECLPKDWNAGWPNVWLGVSVENNDYRDRIKLLATVPAAVRFVSFEPLLSPIDALFISKLGIGWAIIGGESGPKRRDCGVEAICDLAEQLRLESVATFVKQDCAFRPGTQGRIPHRVWSLKQFPVSA